MALIVNFAKTIFTTKTLRPIVSQTASEASPVLCLKEPFKYDIGFTSVDYVFGIEGCARVRGGNVGIYFGMVFGKSVEDYN